MHIGLYGVGVGVRDLDHDSWPWRLKALSVCTHLSERQPVSGSQKEKTFERCQWEYAHLEKQVHMCADVQCFKTKCKDF